MFLLSERMLLVSAWLSVVQKFMMCIHGMLCWLLGTYMHVYYTEATKCQRKKQELLIKQLNFLLVERFFTQKSFVHFPSVCSMASNFPNWHFSALPLPAPRTITHVDYTPGWFGVWAHLAFSYYGHMQWLRLRDFVSHVNFMGNFSYLKL